MGGEYKRYFLMLQDSFQNTVGYAKIQVKNGTSKINISVQNLKHTPERACKVLLGSGKSKKIHDFGRLVLDESGHGELTCESAVSDLDGAALFCGDQKIAEGMDRKRKIDWSSFFRKEIGEAETLSHELLSNLEKREAIQAEIPEKAAHIVEIPMETIPPQVPAQVMPPIPESVDLVEEEPPVLKAAVSEKEHVPELSLAVRMGILNQQDDVSKEALEARQSAEEIVEMEESQAPAGTPPEEAYVEAEEQAETAPEIVPPAERVVLTSQQEAAQDAHIRAEEAAADKPEAPLMPEIVSPTELRDRQRAEEIVEMEESQAPAGTPPEEAYVEAEEQAETAPEIVPPAERVVLTPQQEAAQDAHIKAEEAAADRPEAPLMPEIVSPTELRDRQSAEEIVEMEESQAPTGTPPEEAYVEAEEQAETAPEIVPPAERVVLTPQQEAAQDAHIRAEEAAADRPEASLMFETVPSVERQDRQSAEEMFEEASFTPTAKQPQTKTPLPPNIMPRESVTRRAPLGPEAYDLLLKLLRMLPKRRELSMEGCDWFAIEDRYAMLQRLPILWEPFACDDRLLDETQRCLIGIRFDLNGRRICMLAYGVPKGLWPDMEHHLSSCGFTEEVNGYLLKKTKL